MKYFIGIMSTLLCIAMFSACAPRIKLSEGGKRVRVVRSERDIKGCKLVGKTTVRSDTHFRRHTLKTKARNNAAASKGTHIIEIFDPNGSDDQAVYHVYRCPYGVPKR